ncbi:MAG: PQQ-binding-like beta-propeller repeat protein, partial [Gemmataceae bacterium]
MIPTPLALMGMVALLAADPAPKASWNQWRGPQRDGIVRDAAPWPADLTNLTQKFKVSNLGPSYSGPVMDGERIYTTETRDKKTEWVTAYDRKSGKKVWEQTWEGAMTVPFFAGQNGSWIRSTPTLDGTRLYIGGIRDVLVCLDATNGKIVWKKDFPTDLKATLPAFGMVCSPLVSGEAVYVQAGASIAKLDKNTGQLIWQSLKDDGGMFGSAFSSPIEVNLQGRSQIVVQTRTKLAGIAPSDGQVLWEKAIPAFRGMNILTPIVIDNGIFTSTYGGTTQLLKINKQASGAFAAEGQWSQKYEGHMTTPVVVKNHAYFLGKDQR